MDRVCHTHKKSLFYSPASKNLGNLLSELESHFPNLPSPSFERSHQGAHLVASVSTTNRNVGFLSFSYSAELRNFLIYGFFFFSRTKERKIIIFSPFNLTMRDKKRDRTQKKACKAWRANIGEGNDVTSDPYGNHSRSNFGMLDGQNSLLISDKIVIFSHSNSSIEIKRKIELRRKLVRPVKLTWIFLFEKFGKDCGKDMDVSSKNVPTIFQNAYVND